MMNKKTYIIFSFLFFFVFSADAVDTINETKKSSTELIEEYLSGWPRDQDPRDWDNFFRPYCDLVYQNTRGEELPDLLPILYPSSLIKVTCDAQNLARCLLRSSTVSDSIELITKTVIATQCRDTYMVFLLVKELYQQSNSQNATKDAFTFAARLVMNAPFFLKTSNEGKRNSGSFKYFAECASNMALFQDLATIIELEPERPKLLDDWEIYFNPQAYPDSVPWLQSLYYFYTKEASWIEEFKPPINSKKWEEITHKIVYQDKFYDSDWMTIQESQHKIIGVTDSNGHFLSTDINIYWRLLPLLKNHPNYLKTFYENMKNNRADESTVIDDKGTTVRQLLENIGFDANSPNTTKRIPFRDITNTKRRKTNKNIE